MLDVLSGHKEFFGDIPVKELLAFVCLAYPDMVVGSARHRVIKLGMERYILALL